MGWDTPNPMISIFDWFWNRQERKLFILYYIFNSPWQYNINCFCEWIFQFVIHCEFHPRMSCDFVSRFAFPIYGQTLRRASQWLHMLISVFGSQIVAPHASWIGSSFGISIPHNSNAHNHHDNLHVPGLGWAPPDMAYPQPVQQARRAFDSPQK